MTDLDLEARDHQLATNPDFDLHLAQATDPGPIRVVLWWRGERYLGTLSHTPPETT